MAEIAKGKLSTLTAIKDSKALKGLGILGDAVTVGDNLITLNDYKNGKATGLDLLNKTALTAAAGLKQIPAVQNTERSAICRLWLRRNCSAGGSTGATTRLTTIRLQILPRPPLSETGSSPRRRPRAQSR